MNRRKFSRTKIFISGSIGLMLIFGAAHIAAQIDIAQKPLYLGSEVDPNILLVIDDSGSMDLTVTLSEGARLAHSNQDDESIEDNDMEFEEPTDNWDAYRLCPGFNVLAYDPNKTYTPWAGKNKKGDTYPDRVYNRGARYYALKNPYAADKSYHASYDFEDDNDFEEITDFLYFEWIENQPADQIYEQGECSILNDNYKNIGTRCDNTDGCKKFIDLDDDMKKNYTNWYSYYRKRDYVAKKAILALANDSDARMGLGTLHNNNNVGTPIEDMKTQANKDTLIDKIGKIRPNGSTPARQSLKRAGEYFKTGSLDLFESWQQESPILPVDQGGACQKNFTIIMTDGYSNGGNPSDIGNRDNDSDEGNNTEFDGGIFSDDASRTLADVAMKYYEEDLRPDLDDRVSPTALEKILLRPGSNISHQRMITYTVAFGVNGELSCSPYPGTACETSWDKWPNVNYPDDRNTPKTIDDVRHAAFNGRGEFLSAQTPEELIDGLENALKAITSNSSSAAVATSSTSLISGTEIYQGVFNSGNWSGNVFALPISTGNNPASDNCSDVSIGDVCPTPRWDAAARLAAKDPDQRVIITNLTTGINQSGLAFGNDGAIINALGGDSSSDQCGTGGNVTVCLSASGGANSIELSWTVSGGNINNIQVYRHTQPAANGRARIAQPGDTTSYTDTDVANGTTYYYWIKFATGGADQYNSGSASARLGVSLNSTTGDASKNDEINDLIRYLRGETVAGANFRERDVLLGDIINSSPVFVGAPQFSYPDTLETSPYSEFATAQAERKKMVYVGANDGMLHGFDANTGDEELAYIPSVLFPELANFASPTYTHQYYVDGSPSAGDVFFSGLSGKWRTLLVGGLRAGGKSIYALDITSPDKFTEANADKIMLWEFTDADLGLTFSRPDIIKTHNDTENTWGVIFGNGYNAEDGNNNGYAHLFIVNAESGDLIRKITVGVQSAGTVNGLATVTPVDIDGDHITDYVYAGDLLGDLYRFDLRNDSPSNWTGTKIFSTEDPDGKSQKITSRPSVTFHPEGLDGLLVMFGTGSYITNTDLDSNQQTQTFYAVWDKLAELPTDFDRSATTTSYVQQTITLENAGLRLTSNNNIDWTEDSGWYIDLMVDDADSNNGERQVTDSVVRGDRVVFVTSVPNSGACEAGGSSYLMELNTNGGGVPTLAPFDTNFDGVIDDGDLMLNGNISTPVTGLKLDGIISTPTIIDNCKKGLECKISSSSTGSAESIGERPPSNQADGKRQSWSEVLN